jgi:TPR repeat protein
MCGRGASRSRVASATIGFGLLVALAVSPARADIHDEFRECKYQVFPELRETRGTSARTPTEQFCLGYAYWRGNLGLPRDPARAAQLFRSAAEQGHLGAQTLLGYHYEQGHGVPRNYDEALRWFRAAAGRGYAPAMFHLGRLYSAGKGVPHDDAAAEGWFRKAAEGGSADAIIALREAREYELDLPARATAEQAYGAYRSGNVARAAGLYRSAAGAGNASAQVALGTMLRRGEGGSQNVREAVEWYRKAAERGYSQAQAQLGFSYELGEGVADDWREAAKWCRQSAAGFNRLGLYCLARQYQFGIGVPQDRAAAIRYFDHANDFGDEVAAWFARWLRFKANCIGYRNERERERALFVCDEPAGIAFANTRERNSWLAQKVAALQARADALRRSMSEYGGGMCGAAGGTWGGGGCRGDGGRYFDPGQQDRYGRPLW